MTRLVLLALTAGLLSAEPLETILARMDGAAKTSLSYSANVKWDEFTKVLNTTDQQIGALKLKKSKGRVMGRLDIEKPDAFTWHFFGDIWEKYLPKAKIVQEYQVSKLAKSTDQYLLPGLRPERRRTEEVLRTEGRRGRGRRRDQSHAA